MKRLLAVAFLSLLLTGCEVVIDLGEPNMGNPPAAKTEYPAVNLPVSLRQSNWLGSKSEGSCVHATMITLLRWQGRYNTADNWRRNQGNGEWPEDLAAKFDKAGVRYAYTTQGDPEFLEWACLTRRGCGVTVMGGKHMVALVHFDAEWAGILDNNDINKITWVPRDTFVTEWQNSNGWAVTPVYTPAPPLP
ncbi:MAG: hypothetical protein ACYC35_00505 [Pirellulales bacterium]|jgi:hypothetical protein